MGMQQGYFLLLVLFYSSDEAETSLGLIFTLVNFSRDEITEVQEARNNIKNHKKPKKAFGFIKKKGKK